MKVTTHGKNMNFVNTHTDASRSRKELSKEYLIAKIGVDTAENGPFKILKSKNGCPRDEHGMSGNG